MQTPFEILDVAEDAGDEAIKKAYLRKVREFPPEQQGGEAFRQIRAAYERIADDRQRRRYRLFHREPPDPSALLRQALRPGLPQRPDPATLFGALAEAVADHLAKGDGEP